MKAIRISMRPRPAGLLVNLICALTLLACGGSGSSGGSAGTSAACTAGSTSAQSRCGEVIVAFTDAEGDFASYTVDVLAITLERADGSAVEVLPQTARIDFARLTELSELVGAASLPPGVFVRGSIRLDYSAAEIWVESGDDIVPLDVYDRDNVLLTDDTPASIVDVEIELPASDRLVVTRGSTALLSVDFDLAASHIVDTAASPARAVASPYFVAEIEPVDEKELRVRGALVAVDVDNGSYDIRIRPWQHRAGDYGVFTVLTTNATAFEVNGVDYTGTAGLRALAALPAGTLTVAFGTLDFDDRSFTAAIVHAGDSVEGTRYSAVLGNIVARSGDRLVIKGAVAIRRDRRAHFQRTVVVEIGPGTGVSRVGDPDGHYDKDDLSVGQRTLVFGEFLNPELDTSDRFGPDIALVLDATEGRARMLVTHLLGSVEQSMPGLLTVELKSIDRLSAGMFDFTGTGTAPDYDADPASYEIATASLPLDAVELARPVRVFGFVAPFGEAPPDFVGRALVGPRDLPATLGIGWGPEGTLAPFTQMGATSLVLDLDNPAIGSRHHMLLGHELIDLFDLPASPSIEQSGPPRVYGIWEPGHIELFKNFDDFVDELAQRLTGADRALSLAAYGRYASGESRLTANKIVVHMQPADVL